MLHGTAAAAPLAPSSKKERDKRGRFPTLSDGPPGISPDQVQRRSLPILQSIHETLARRSPQHPRRVIYVLHRPIFLRKGRVVKAPQYYPEESLSQVNEVQEYGDQGGFMPSAAPAQEMPYAPPTPAFSGGRGSSGSSYSAPGSQFGSSSSQYGQSSQQYSGGQEYGSQRGSMPSAAAAQEAPYAPPTPQFSAPSAPSSSSYSQPGSSFTPASSRFSTPSAQYGGSGSTVTVQEMPYAPPTPAFGGARGPSGAPYAPPTPAFGGARGPSGPSYGSSGSAVTAQEAPYAPPTPAFRWCAWPVRPSYGSSGSAATAQEAPYAPPTPAFGGARGPSGPSYIALLVRNCSILKRVPCPQQSPSRKLPMLLRLHSLLDGQFGQGGQGQGTANLSCRKSHKR
ncbi:hypothetical protein COOONC_07316 [Cooperia oncophora]